MNIQQKLDSFSMVLADHIRANDQMIKQFEELQKEVKEIQNQPVNTNWYDFTDEQKQKLSEFVESFIERQIRNGRTTVDTYSSDNGFDIEIRFDCEDLIRDMFEYHSGDNFIEFLEDEITELRKEQQQDCEESENN